MTTLQITDNFIENILIKEFQNNSKLFIEEIKEYFKNKYRQKSIEYSLLQAYHRGELSTGQVATILNISKYDVLELLKEYHIPFVEIDEEYLLDELKAFEK